MSGKEAPESVNWYIDIIKWLIGIAAGMLVFGFDKFKTESWPGWLTVVYLMAAALLALCVVFGILACWQWLPYANRIEMGHSPDDKAVEQLATRGSTFYSVMASMFLLGVLMFSTVWAAAFLRSTPDQASTGIRLIPGGNDSAFLIVAPEPGTMNLRVLTQDGENKYSWKPVQIPGAR